MGHVDPFDGIGLSFCQCSEQSPEAIILFITTVYVSLASKLQALLPGFLSTCHGVWKGRNRVEFGE